MVYICAVENCDRQEHNTLFKAPSEQVYRVWKETIGYEGRAKFQSFRLCSKHFSDHQHSEEGRQGVQRGAAGLGMN